MTRRRKPKTVKKAKPSKKRKPKAVKKNKVKRGRPKKYPTDQFQNLDLWLEFYQEHKKFPHSRVVCAVCRNGFASLKGRGSKTAFERCEGDPRRVLQETRCKDCREVIPKKPKVYTKEEMEERADEIRKNLPKIDLNKERVVIDLRKNKAACQEYTKISCMRPDIYLDNDRTCDNCGINKNCACPLKKFSKGYLRDHK